MASASVPQFPHLEMGKIKAFTPWDCVRIKWSMRIKCLEWHLAHGACCVSDDGNSVDGGDDDDGCGPASSLFQPCCRCRHFFWASAHRRWLSRGLSRTISCKGKQATGLNLRFSTEFPLESVSDLRRMWGTRGSRPQTERLSGDQGAVEGCGQAGTEGE